MFRAENSVLRSVELFTFLFIIIVIIIIGIDNFIACLLLNGYELRTVSVPAGLKEQKQYGSCKECVTYNLLHTGEMNKCNPPPAGALSKYAPVIDVIKVCVYITCIFVIPS